jgi:ABC-type molybdate transport system substrate-binding protein
MFSAGIMEQATNPEDAGRLITFLSSEAVASIIESTGLVPEVVVE